MKIWDEKIKGKTWWFADFTLTQKGYPRGKRHRVRAESKKELNEIIDAARRRVRREKYGLEDLDRSLITVADLVAERSKDLDLKKKLHRHMLAIITRFCDFFDEPLFPVEQIKQAHLRSFVQSLKRENPKLRGSSINTYLNMINALLHSAERNFPELETWKPPRMPFESVPEEGRERLITEEEQARIFFELRAPRGQVGTRHRRIEKIEEVRARHTVADLLDFALLTGMRNTEARTLNSSKIDWTVRTIRDDRSGQDVTIYGEIALTKTKTGKKRKVPLNRDARELLERRNVEIQSEWLFPNTAGTRPMSETVVRRILQRAAARAKVPYGQRTEDGIVFHDSRHTAATNMLQSGSDLKTVGAILGHTDESMTMRYSHATVQSKARAVGSLERSKSATAGVKVDNNSTAETE